MEGDKPVGRPRTRWKDVLRRDMASSELRPGEAATRTKDCDRWKTIVLPSCDYSAAGKISHSTQVSQHIILYRAFYIGCHEIHF